MDRTRDCDDYFAVSDKAVTLEFIRYRARIRELALDVFVFLKCQYILSRADESYN